MKVSTRAAYATVLLTMLGLGPPASAELAAGSACGSPEWSIVRSPNKGPSDNDLRGVAAVSGTDAWAVGSSIDPETRSNTPLILRWDGATWETVRAAGVTHGSLQAVDAAATEDVWAVGSRLTRRQTSAPVALHWDGKNWDQVRVPAARPGSTVSTVLTAVETLGPADAWAVGYWSPGGEYPPRPVIEHWNGSGWRVVDSPGLDSWSELQGVAATGPDDVWAVGNVEVTVGRDFVERGLIEHWDGTAWTVVRTPFVGGRLPFALESVDARTPDDAWAVGQSDGRSVLGLAFHWDGDRWRSASILNPSDQFQLMTSVAVAARHRVVVVGTYWDRRRRDYTSLIEGWNGRTWVQKSPGHRQGDNELNGVAVLPSAQFAVGGFWAHGGDGPQRTLVVQRCAG